LKKLLRLTVCLFISFLFGAGCSIFDLKNPAPPSLGTQEQDPLNIRTIIMSVAHEVAADMSYRYYFTDDVLFDSFNFQPQDKNNIIRMLDRLRMQVSFVDWKVESAQKIPEHNNRWFVKDMQYIVYSKDGEQITGAAKFRIVKDPDWMISYWKDMPDDNTSAFFEPY